MNPTACSIIGLLLAGTCAPGLLLASAAGEPAFLCGTARSYGCETWTTVTDDPGYDYATYAVMSPDGTRIHSLGARANASLDMGREVVTRAYDAATGTILWSASYHEGLQEDGVGNGTYTTGIAAGSRMTYTLVDVTEGHVGTPHFVVLAYDSATGGLMWQRYVWLTLAFSIALSPDETRLYIGYEPSWPGDFAAFALNATTGALLWNTAIDGLPGPDRVEDRPWAMALSPDGARLVLTGTSRNVTTGGYDVLTIAYDTATGAAQWQARLPGLRGVLGTAYDAFAFRVRISPDSELVYIQGSEGTRAYDARTGALAWRPFHEITCVQHYDQRCRIEVDPQGAAIFVATTREMGAYDAKTGDLLWNLPLTFPSGDFTEADLAVHPDGRTIYLFIGGAKTDAVLADPTQYRATAVEAYDAKNGTLLWRTLNQIGTYDDVDALTIAPDGNHIFAFKEFSTTGFNLGVALLAYPTDLGFRAADSPTRPII